MPGQAPVLTDERELLLAYIDQQRDGIRFAAYGLTDEQARQAPTVSTLTIGGLVKHVTAMEQSWLDLLLERQTPASDAEAGEAATRTGSRSVPTRPSPEPSRPSIG